MEECKRLIDQHQPFIYNCERCGREVDSEKYLPGQPVTDLMAEKSLCHQCAYWEWYFATHKEIEIVKGHLFTFGEQLFNEHNHFRTIRTRRIMHTDRTVKVLRHSRDMGPVPTYLSMKDTGVFVSPRTFDRVARVSPDFSCTAIGCYDRYHCLWYDKKKREPFSPWNIVPKDWHPGDENCISFINKALLNHK